MNHFIGRQADASVISCSITDIAIFHPFRPVIPLLYVSIDTIIIVIMWKFERREDRLFSTPVAVSIISAIV